MRRRMVLLAVSSLLAPLMFGGQESSAQPGPQLSAVPPRGHSGDLIDLSGTGLPPNRQLYVMMACPSWHAPNAFDNGNVVLLGSGPKTDDNGEFAGYMMRAITLHKLPESTCQIQTSDGETPFNLQTPARYKIVGPHTVLAPCEQHMCVRLSLSSREVRAGLTEHIKVDGWPGARVDLIITYSGQRTSRQTVRRILDWRGTAWYHDRLPTSGMAPSSVTVQVRATLGSMKANKQGRFQIVH